MKDEKTNPSGAPIAACDVEHRCALVSCSICLTEIPSDVALSHEGPDYVQHFCGLDCMEAWKRKSAK